MIKNVLEYSIENNLGHIPSALSMLQYIDFLTKNVLKKDWNIIIGKPFGSQSYYKIWEKYWNIKIENLSYGVKHEEVDFVDYSEETLGNALGIASGIQLSNNKKTWCNISDGALQMGPTLEAVQFIGKMNQDILLTVDYNNHQLTGEISRIMNINIENVSEMFTNFNWNSLIIKDVEEFLKIEDFIKIQGPKVILFETKKGMGVKEMEENPIEWHYRKLKNIEEITIIGDKL